MQERLTGTQEVHMVFNSDFHLNFKSNIRSKQANELSHGIGPLSLREILFKIQYIVYLIKVYLSLNS